MLIERIEREDIDALAESPVFRGLSAEEQKALVEDLLDRYGAAGPGAPKKTAGHLPGPRPDSCCSSRRILDFKAGPREKPWENR